MDTPSDPCFQFYVPRNRDFQEIPESDSEVWTWICNHPSRPDGRTVWTLYTSLLLHKSGINCVIVREFPSAGIVISHRDFLPATLRPHRNVYLVCIKPDRKRHSWAHVHIVQNSNDPLAGEAGPRGRAPCVPFWPQPSLISRHPARNAKVENIAYFGRSLNLDPGLRGLHWSQELESHGYHWQEVPLKRWHDYSEVDVSVSIRGFGDTHAVSDPTMSSDTKPPTKLTNSWLAGVPAIVGGESAFLAVRKSELDFIVANSKAELVDAINRLANDPGLYNAMVENGRMRSQEFSVDAIASIWKGILHEDIAPRHRQWHETPAVTRSLDNWRSYFQYWINPGNISTAARALFRR